MLSLLLVWALITCACTAGLLLFLAFDEWQVKSKAVQTPATAVRTASPHATGSSTPQAA